MKCFKLEKEIILYKPQFDRLCVDVFGDHKLDRLSLDADALLFRIKYMMKHNKDRSDLDKLRREFTLGALKLRNTFGQFMYEFLIRIIQIPKEFKLDDIKDVLAQDVKIDSVNVKFKMILLSENKEYLEYVDESIPEGKVYNIFPNEYFRYSTDSYNDAIAKAYPELFENRHQDKIGTGEDGDVFCHNFTFQTSERCSLNCTYCYQFNKTNMKMSFETAKKFIDNLLADKYGYINRYNSPAIILEFIGGEPLLEINLTRKIYEYFLDQCYELNHPWFKLHRVSICSNGLQYFDDEVQDFFKEYSSNISFNISIDGNRELHDTCRIQPNGEGSYDVDMVALNHFNKNYATERNSKMTLAPSNISYLFESVVDFINHDMKCINLNCVFEEGWTPETAKIEYNQLKKLADYILENDLENIYIAIFNERQEDMQSKYNDGKFCFKAGTQVLTENGNIPIENINIGDVLYTASGSKHKVVKMTSYNSNDNKILKVRGSYPIHCTSDHKVFAKKFLYTGWKDVKHYSEPGFFPVSELKKGDKIALPILDLSKNKKNWINMETAYAIGVFLADGHISKNNVVITPGYDEDKYYYNILKLAKLEFHDFKNRTTMVYTIPRSKNSFNERFFKVCESCGNLAHNKHFPRIIFESPIEIIKECIRGYCDTDWYTVTKINSHMKNGLIKVNSASELMMNDLLILLRSIGELPTTYYYPMAGKMHIEEREVNVRDRYEVYYLPGNNIEMSKYFQSDEKYPVIWSRVNGIFDDPESYDVYCPTVMPINDNDEEEHTIIVEGIAAQQCGGGGSMLALRPNGQFYPCIRYMPTSVGDNVKDLCIGNVDTGLIGRENESEILDMLDNITRRSQNNDICFECPLSNDCASCLALGHTVFGTPNKRTNFICIQMIAEALANVYYWNNLILKHPEYDLYVRKNNVPDEWSLLVIDEEELVSLKLLECAAIAKVIDRKSND